MTVSDRCSGWLGEVRHHLRDELLPFWATHGEDREFGGYLTYFDRDGKPTGETVKTLLCQARMIYTYASAHRAGHGDGAFLDIAGRGFDFVTARFWDDDHGGWFWTAERDGTPLNTSKLTYGQSFMLYALSEYAMASGDPRAHEWVQRTYETLHTFATDVRHGGYHEFMERDWTLKRPGKYGGDRKSFDVHMHLMEAFTNLHESTGSAAYRGRAVEVIGLIRDRILHPVHGTGVAQFAHDWTPLPQILFADVWGSDRDAEEGEARPLDNTSYGHNVEFAWLLAHAVRILGLDMEEHKPVLRRLYDQCLRHGLDRERGGVFCEGPHDGPARERNKEFWQQAECLVGFLDAYRVFGDPAYLDAYACVHRFVMDHVIHHSVGEWFPLLDEENRVVWDYMGHAWKINYHTVRSMIQSEERLLRIIETERRAGR
jgi:mannose 2-epimerase